jgi:hypothetical protein
MVRGMSLSGKEGDILMKRKLKRGKVLEKRTVRETRLNIKLSNEKTTV